MNVSDSDPLWPPELEASAHARITAIAKWLRRERGLSFSDIHSQWTCPVSDIAGFWDAIAEFFEVRFASPASLTLGNAAVPGAVKFPSSELNNADRLLGGARSGPAIISVHEHGSGKQGDQQHVRTEVAAFAGNPTHQSPGTPWRNVAHLRESYWQDQLRQVG